MSKADKMFEELGFEVARHNNTVECTWETYGVKICFFVDKKAVSIESPTKFIDYKTIWAIERMAAEQWGA